MINCSTPKYYNLVHSNDVLYTDRFTIILFIVDVGDQEFHSVKLEKCLSDWGIDFALRQKNNTCISDDEQVYLALQDFKIEPGKRQFYSSISCTKSHQLDNFNLAAYGQRKYRGKAPKAPWYILTSLPTLELALSFYAARWGTDSFG
jgi:hypothetical protein